MGGAPKPANELQRLRALRRLSILDSEPEAAFDEIAQLAAEFFDVPIALVSLLDDDRLWFKSRVGYEEPHTRRELALCAWAVYDNAFLEVNDATRDPRFADNPMVLGAPDIRFYAGAPIPSEHGALGTLSVIDREKRQLTEDQRHLLQRLADIAGHTLQFRRAKLDSARRGSLLELAKQVAEAGH